MLEVKVERPVSVVLQQVTVADREAVQGVRGLGRQRRDRDPGLASGWPSPRVNMSSMLIRQKARFKGDSIAHELRNLTGTRPWKL